MLELDEYKKYLVNECTSSAQVNETSPDDEFIDYVMDLFEQNEEAIGLNKSYFEMVGPKNRKILIDGWGYDEADQSFILFCSQFDQWFMTPTLINTEIEKYIRNMEAFVENSLSGYIQQNAEFTSPGRGAAVTLKLYSDNNQINKFKFYIISNIPLSKTVKASERSKIDGKDVKIEIWDLERIYRSDKSNQQKEEISIDVTKYVKGGLKCIKAFEEENEEYTAYLAVVPGRMLYDIYDEYGSRLLEGNVRSFLSTTGKVNKGIKRTIENQPTYFFTYNNGIATTAKDVEIKNDCITNITNLQIINGGQTTASIFFTKYNDKNNIVNLDKIYVAMKLTVVNNEEKYGSVIENISRCSNTQNKVSDADFFSNSVFHRKIKEYSEQLYAPRKEGQLFDTRWFYERARGSYKQEQMKLTPAKREKFKRDYPKEQMITKTDLAKYYLTYLKLPYIVSKGAQFAMKRFAEVYEKSLKNAVDEKFFTDCVALAIIYRESDKLLQKQSWYITGYKAYTLTYAMSKLFDMIETRYNKQLQFDFTRVWKDQTMYPELKSFMMVLCKAAQDLMTDPNREMQNIIEWGRKESCWKKFQNINIEMPGEFVNTLIGKDVVAGEKWTANKDRKFDESVNAQIQVVQAGHKFWEEVLQQCNLRGIVINHIQMQDIKKAIAMKDGKTLPNSFECKRLLQFLKKAIEDGLNLDIID